MPNLFQFHPAQVIGFLIILTRISGVLVIAPSAEIPARFSYSKPYLAAASFASLLCAAISLRASMNFT